MKHHLDPPLKEQTVKTPQKKSNPLPPESVHRLLKFPQYGKTRLPKTQQRAEISVIIIKPVQTVLVCLRSLCELQCLFVFSIFMDPFYIISVMLLLSTLYKM